MYKEIWKATQGEVLWIAWRVLYSQDKTSPRLQNICKLLEKGADNEEEYYSMARIQTIFVGTFVERGYDAAIQAI